MDYSGKTCVVTGAASGIGFALVKEALNRRMHVVMVDLNAAALNKAKDQIAGHNRAITLIPCDVSNAESVAKMAADAIAVAGVPALVFNNAGVSTQNGLVWEADPVDWEWVFGVNVMGVANGIRSFVPQMLSAAEKDESFRGRIVNVASMGGLFNPALCAVYSASKHAVVSISETLHHDLDIVTSQVRCSVVCPYYVSTNINNAERTRPERFRKDGKKTRSAEIAQEFSDTGMTSAKLPTPAVAALIFDEIAEDRFYILPHKKMLKSVEMRFQDIIGLKTPRDPFSFRPEVGEMLRAELRPGTRDPR
ncbi:MAG: SDR family NAD(P)-dependent oxidoreductase [Xanthobacteraceae bacterium]